MKMMTKGLLAVALMSAGIAGVSKAVCMMGEQPAVAATQESTLEFVFGEQEIDKLKDIYVSFYSMLYKSVAQVKQADLNQRFEDDKKLFASQADAFKVVRVQKDAKPVAFAVLKELEGGAKLQLHRIAFDIPNMQEAAASLRTNIFTLFPKATALCNAVLKTSAMEIALLRQFGFVEIPLIDLVDFKAETHTSYSLNKGA